MRDKPLSLGTFVMPWGKVAAVGFIEGERYYWLTSHDGDVSMMPADVVEEAPGVPNA
jgi:hypothetical protein